MYNVPPNVMLLKYIVVLCASIETTKYINITSIDIASQSQLSSLTRHRVFWQKHMHISGQFLIFTNHPKSSIFSDNHGQNSLGHLRKSQYKIEFRNKNV